MKHRVLIPTLLMSAIGAPAAFALDKTHVWRNSPQALAQQSPVVEGADNFYRSDKVTVQKVTFKNQYNMQVAGTLFIPKALNQNARNPAIIAGHPMGAVKEQSANLYAQKLAEQGFVTLSLDLSFWGESGRRVRA
ncbi:alpha/beta hydrolase [Trichocoleus sp. ST-U1]|nr:alpha/beta hydrolase [Coleofasciculus sp. FACHB-SPT36]